MSIAFLCGKELSFPLFKHSLTIIVEISFNLLDYFRFVTVREKWCFKRCRDHAWIVINLLFILFYLIFVQRKQFESLKSTCMFQNWKLSLVNLLYFFAIFKLFAVNLIVLEDFKSLSWCVTFLYSLGNSFFDELTILTIFKGAPIEPKVKSRSIF